MGRSVKKGPYVLPVLLKRVQGNERRRREARAENLSRSSTIFPSTLWATPSPCTTAASMCPFTLPKIWSVTSWASCPDLYLQRGHAGSKTGR